MWFLVIKYGNGLSWWRRGLSIAFCQLSIIFISLIAFPATSQNITRAEYFFDTDPGNGNGTAIAVTPGANVTFTATIPTASLNQGFHFLGIRAKETGGVWSIFESRGFYITATTADAPNIVAAEYFFDTDPGNGNGTPIAVTAGATTNFTVALPTASLSPGFHFLAIRTKGLGSRWGLFEARGFYITTNTTDVPNITAAEYFFDSDPGNGNATPIAIAPGATTNFTVALPTGSLSPGFHFLAIRTKGANGKWGIFESRGFYVTGSTTDAPNITAAEYFFDTDPGNGNGTSIPVTAGATTNFTVALPTTSLSPGFHFLAIRTKGANGKWGIFESRGFYVTGSTTDVPHITAAEYFFDTDPGNGNGISIPITAGATTNFTATIPITGLTPGFHFLAIRTKGADGKWGIFESRGFYVSPINTTVGDIVEVEYFFDTDPGEGNGLAVTVNPTGPTINQIFPIAIIGITSGPHKLGMRVKDADGIWSAVQMENFDVLVCTPPTAPTVPAASRCNSGSVTLTATSGATGSQVYKWYADATVATSLFTGASFVTPSISASTDYFVTVFDPATLCESARTKVTAGVISTSPPTLNVTGSVTICEGNTITLIAPAGFSVYLWSTGAGTQTISVSTAGNYTVQVGNGICTSVPSAAANVVVAARPAKPVVSITGSLLCVGQPITLQAPAGFTYAWSNGATTQQIAPTLAGSYTVTVTDANGCTSLASDAVVIHTLPPKPAVFLVGGTTICQGQSTTLIGPTGLASYLWNTGATTPQLIASSSGNYTLSVTDAAGCSSVESDPVAIIVNPSLAKPVITASGPTSFCSGGAITLSAPVGFNYQWSTGATAQTITANASGNYTVRVTDGSNCASELSDPVVVTVSSVPAKPVVEIFGSTSLCGTNTVALLAPSGFATYQWSGGQITQGITVSTAGSYTVRVGNSVNCLSPPSDAVAVTSTNQPCTGNSTPNSPPSIASAPLAIIIEGKLIFDLTTILSDPDNNIDFTSLRVVGNATSRGASASVSSSFELIVDYNGMPFTGIDRITIEVCDLSGACVQRVINIDVVGDVEIFNGLTPDGDGLNDFMIIKYVDVVENAAQNKVIIYNRWGDVVFDIDNYDNLSRVFAGETNSGKELPTGTYFYKIDFSNGKSITGFISLKR
jgi:gliding motility-associated-like protein